jgi:hypothetical protein
MNYFKTLAMFGLVGVVHSAPVSYWVWQRPDPLNQEEIRVLEQSGINELYWQYGTLTCRDGKWIWKERYGLPPSSINVGSPVLVPVIRLEPLQQFTPSEFLSLISELDQLARSRNCTFLQLDYEAPDRLLPVYKDFLRELKSRHYSWHLSITALAHWSRFARDFEGLVDEIAPMFYDLGSGHEHLSKGRLPAMICPETIDQILAWKNCPVSWKAGLPSFCRVSLVDRSGITRGNIRGFHLEEIWFSPFLKPEGPTTGGETVFLVLENGSIGDTPIHKGERVVVREPTFEGLNTLRNAASRAGASGVIFFHLPKRGDGSCLSVRALCSDGAGVPRLTVQKIENGCIRLVNSSDIDLLPAATVDSRGYALALRGPVGSWREAVSGDFARVTTDRAGSCTVGDEIPPCAEEIYFWFSQLPAGGTLTSGLLQSASSSGISFRILNISPDSPWQPLR